ncbi:MAG: nitroreductase family protein [Clostridia bacterium]|nr:nitroreductase family protein [Clostridia bacterium]
MEFLELAKNRYSVRKFKQDPVPEDAVMKILEAARVAPTACNFQPQKIIAVRTAEGLEKFRRCTECHFDAPLGIVVCYDKTRCWNSKISDKSSGEIDATIAATQMMLEAADLGLGSTPVLYFIEEAVRHEFSLPDNVVPVLVIPMGYPADDAAPSKMHSTKRELSDTVIFE